jgi:branched-chain amino acid transport system permease protein
VTPVVVGIVLGVATFLVVDRMGTDYAYLAAYIIFQYVVLGTAWNILGGYVGYVNFGTAGFFAVGIYTSVVVYKTVQWSILLILPLAGLIAGLLGLGMGYLTLRLRGIFFSISTLALTVVLQTLVVNWDFVGGSRGVYIVRPETAPFFGNYVHFLFALMIGLTVISVLIARAIQHSWLGRGFTALRDDELAAEAVGVPALRLKLIATTLSGALMGMVGAMFPYFVTFVDANSAFSLTITVNSIAMPLIGGTMSWIGPVIGALLLGTLQQIAMVTFSSAVNLTIVGVALVVFVGLAPKGIIGLVQSWWQRSHDH